MKNGRKYLAFFAVLALCAMTLCGCHGSETTNQFAIPSSFDESREYEIAFWAKNDTNKVQIEIYKKAIEDFEKLYPNITVNLRLYTDYGKIYNDVITNIATGTTPNVCVTYPDHIATYLTGSNVVVPLDSLFADAKYGLGGSEVKFDVPSQEEIVPQFLDECKIGDKHYAIPFMRSTEACYVNRDFVEKLGYTLPEQLTWDFVWEVSEAATAKDADGNFLINGQKVMIPFIYKSTDNMMIQMLLQQGAGYSTSDAQIDMFNETAEEILYTVAEHAQTGAFSTFKISSYPANFLNAGQCIFAIDSTAGATWMGTKAPNLDISADKLVDFETAVMTIPQYDAENPLMISQGPSVCVFNKPDSQEVLASWLFAQYLLTNDVQLAYSATEGYVPVTNKAQNSPEYQEYLSLCGADDVDHYDVKIQASKLLIDNVEHTFVTPVFNGSASLRDAAGQMIENVTKAVRRKMTVDNDFLGDLYIDMITLFHLDQLGGNSDEKADLGPLPSTAMALLVCLAAVWVLLGALALYRFVKPKITRK